ncbi:MAG: AGE family epimerase/isomerase [Bacteroidales bacterium]|nr:AGE family epimerase/isomerase [Bacteroidales bacterium]
MNNDELIKQLKSAHADILRYWTNNMVDNKNGGFYGERDCNEQVVAGAKKGAILNGRILWTYAKAANEFGDINNYRAMAQRAYEYICKYFYDSKNGGFYWSLNEDGSPADTKKQGYAQSFVMYGLSEYYILTKDPKALQLAVETYHLIEKHFRDTKLGGYTEACAADWSPIEDVRLSDKEENMPKTMNTHLHVLEAFTNLYRANPTPELRESIVHCVNIFKDKIIDAKTGHFNLFFAMDWTPSKTMLVDSYGHDIEGAWLIYEAAEVIDDKPLMEALKPACKRLVDVTIEEGFDGESINYEKVNGHLDTDRHWWPQAETLVGLADTYRLTGDQKYLEYLYKVWAYIDAHLVDHKNGDWYWRVNKEGNAVYTDMKAGFWKCPYHNSRAMIEVINRLK